MSKVRKISKVNKPRKSRARKPAIGDVIAVTWRDHEIHLSMKAKDLASTEPPHFVTMGIYSCDSDDGLFMIISHNVVINKGGLEDSSSNDHTRILKNCVESIEILKKGIIKK